MNEGNTIYRLILYIFIRNKLSSGFDQLCKKSFRSNE